MAGVSEGDGISVDVSVVESVTVVTVTGVVDMVTAPVLTQHLDAALADRPPALVVDLTSVEFLASAGLETLLHAHLAAEDHTKLAVVAEGPVTSRPITLTGIDNTIALYSTLDIALAELSG